MPRRINRLKLWALCLILFGFVGCKPASQLDSKQKHLAKGLSLYADAKYRESLKEIRIAAKEAPNDPDIKRLLGDLWLVLGDPKQAELNYLRAIELGKPNNTVIVNLAESRLQQRKYKEIIAAEFSEQEPLPLDAEKAQFYAIKALALLALDQHDLANEQIKKAFEIDLNHSKATIAAAKLKILNNKLSDAKEYINKALWVDPKNYDGWVLLGDLHRLNNNLPEAERAYTKAIQVSERNGYRQQFAYLYRALVRALQGYYAGAITDTHEARDSGAPGVYIGYLKGIFALWQQNLQASQVALDVTLQKENPYPFGYYFMAANFIMQKDYAKAAMYLESFQRAFPGSIKAEKLQALIEARTNRTQDAERRIIYLIDQGHLDPMLLRILSEIKMLEGDIEKANLYEKKAQSLDFKISTQWLNTNLFEVIKGEDAAAKKTLEQILVMQKLEIKSSRANI